MKIKLKFDIKVKSSPVLLTSESSWFSDLNRDAKAKYLKIHPDSKFKEGDKVSIHSDKHGKYTMRTDPSGRTVGEHIAASVNGDHEFSATALKNMVHTGEHKSLLRKFDDTPG